MSDISKSPPPAAAVPTLKPAQAGLWIRERMTLSRAASIVLLGVAAIFFALHFVHLTADFPNNSPWNDWSKYTDEGWYGDAAIRHYVTGHWYWKGDFNPAVALPVWPAIEFLVFRVSGVSLVAARALTLGVFGCTLVILYLLMQRHTGPYSAASGSAPGSASGFTSGAAPGPASESGSRSGSGLEEGTPPPGGQSLAAPIAVLLLCTSPFLFVFERMAILEPLLIALTALGLLTASHLRPLRLRAMELQGVGATLLLTLILPGIVLTKTTGVFLLPAIFYMVWARAGYRLRPALRLAVPPAFGGVALWCAYFFLFVRPHYLAAYQYLFSANAYTGIDLQPIATVILNTVIDGAWIGTLLYALFAGVIVLALFWRPRLFTNPLFSSLLLWIGGYVLFLAYHNNLQPRYYLVVAVPITAVVAMGLDSLRSAGGAAGRAVGSILCATLVLAVSIPDALQQIEYLRYPTYQFEAAAQGIKRIVLADTAHSHLILSISGSDLTLMTGLPSINDDFGTYDLDARVKLYRPGWYASWNDVAYDKADALTPMYRMKRVAAFPAYDDDDRNLLILYRLDPVSQGPRAPRHRRRQRLPKALVTRIGQQPSGNQLEH